MKHILRFKQVLPHCLVLASFFCSASSSAAGNQTPSNANQAKLVVMLVVDGLPQEQILRYRQQFQGGLKRLLNQGAWFSDAHQAHGITVTAVGHSAILTGAYPYQHGIIGNSWTDPRNLQAMYCTEDAAHTYIGAATEKGDGTSPANLRVSTVGDELRYATGNQAKVIAISGKDRGAILLAGKTGTAYMYMDKTGDFASSTYYMQQHPQWWQKFQAKKPQDQYYGKAWCLAQPASAYAKDVASALKQDGPAKACPHQAFDVLYTSPSGKPDAEYYGNLKFGPYADQLTLDFAKAAIEGENLGRNPAGVSDLLAISLSSHDYVNHGEGPESAKSHDHLQHLDRMLGDFFTYLDKKVGANNSLILLTADHGFPNIPEFAAGRHFDAQRLDGKAMYAALQQHLSSKFGLENALAKWSSPTILLNYAAIEAKGIKREEIENAAARFLMQYDGIAQVFTRSQLENGTLPSSRIGKLMQRAWHRQVSGDLLLVTKPYWYFSGGKQGTSHGSPYSYDTNVPLILMGKNWIKPGAYGQYAEVVDIAPTLSHLLQIRPASGSEGRVLVEVLR